MKQFAKETGDSEKLTELYFILMAIVYDIEKERVGVSHINRTPLLDVSLVAIVSPSGAATLRIRASCGKWVSTFAQSPASTTRFRAGALEAMPVFTVIYPCKGFRIFLHGTRATLTIDPFPATAKGCFARVLLPLCRLERAS